MSGPGGSVLDSSHRNFIQQGVSMLIASRDGANRPCVCRAAGCRILEDGRLKVFLNAENGRRVLDAIAESRAVAAVFSDPPTHQTLQVKSSDAAVVEAGDCQSVIAAYADAFAATLTGLAFSEPMARALVHVEPARVSAVLFTPTAVFDQTPGPGAGAVIATRE